MEWLAGVNWVDGMFFRVDGDDAVSPRVFLILLVLISLHSMPKMTLEPLSKASQSLSIRRARSISPLESASRDLRW